jgi:xylulokinase
MTLLGVDVGTTSCKAGLFEPTGAVLRLASYATPTRTTPEGYAYYEPQELYQTVCTVIRDVTQSGSIAAVGITSMAETGILLDAQTGEPRSQFIPWFDNRAVSYAKFLAQQDNPLDRFSKTGIHPSPKISLAKLLWLHSDNPDVLKGAIWLSAADYITYRLVGQMCTDYSLATRTYAFRIDQRQWDREWLQSLGLPTTLFPPVHSSTEVVGNVHEQGHESSGIPVGIPVYIAGHDHICGALAVGAVAPLRIFDSMGTAEALLGTIEPRSLTQADFESGLSYGCHVVSDRYYWLGGLSSSGGSIEWLRDMFGKDQLTYQQLDEILTQTDYTPSPILYFPYLLGSSSSSLNRKEPAVRAAFVGLDASHRQMDLTKAILQGAAYEMERIRHQAESVSGSTIERVTAAGGGTRNKFWMQIKADVSNCLFEVLSFSEVTLLGAAMIAGLGVGLFTSTDQAIQTMSQRNSETFYPDEGRHQIHKQLFEHGYLALQHPLNQYYASLKNHGI